MRTIKMALVGSMAFFFLLSAPAIAAKAIVVHYPGPTAQTYQLTHAVHFYAITGGGGDPYEEVPTFMGEGVIASLIVIFGVYEIIARKKRLDDRGLLYSQFQSALKDFQEQSQTVKLNRAKGYEPTDDTWHDLNAAKAHVDATADAVLDPVGRPASIWPTGTIARKREIQEAEQAKAKTSGILKDLENPPGPPVLT